MISGGLEQLAMDPTVNTTGGTGHGIIPRLKSNGNLFNLFHQNELLLKGLTGREMNPMTLEARIV